MYGVYKVRTRQLWGDAREVKKLAGVFRQEDFALAFMTALHREQMEKIGTILDEYEMREIPESEATGPWPNY